MRKIVSIIGVVAILFYNSCSNEFVLTENWKDITIVYGLLNQADTAHYVRIEKAFLDQETSALIQAKEPDSLFYSNISVELRELPINGSGSGGIYLLERVDGNLEGFQKEEGIFATAPNYLYKTDIPLDENSRYELIINNNDNEKTVTTETLILPDFAVFNPRDDQPLRLEPGNNLTFTWKVSPRAVFFDITMQIHYNEYLNSDPSNKTYKSLDWKVGSRIKPNDASSTTLNMKVETDNFYRFMQNNIEATPNILREIVDVDVIISAGSDDLLQYIEIGLANSGLTGSETLPTYTNISEGLGIFTSRYTKLIPGYNISQIANDSLAYGQYTKNLGFQ